MKAKRSYLLLALLCGSLGAFAGSGDSYQVSDGEIVNGYIVRKIWLDHYARPAVQLLTPQYKALPVPPAQLPASRQPEVMLGMEHRRPFALVKVPAYNGQGQQLTSFSLQVDEPVAAAHAPLTAAKTTGTGSVLATGNWYKIALASRGMYKVDYAFLTSQLGLSGTINSNNIRLYGNGGTMLAEANSVPRPQDLVENAILMQDGGDGVFGPGDYFIFYANGPMAWDKDSVNHRFVHRKNLYEDKSYYFINVDLGSGKRVAAVGSATAPNVVVNSFNDYAVVEDDKVSIGKFGKEWWGDEFSSLSSQALSRTYNFDLGQGVDSLRMRLMVGAPHSDGTETFAISLNGQYISTQYVGFPGDAENFPVGSNLKEYRLPGVSTAAINITYQPYAIDSKGYLNYIEINTRRSLLYAGGNLGFRDWNSVGPGQVAEYHLGNANSNVTVWDITDPLVPQRVNGSFNGSDYVFVRDASMLHEYVAFDGSQYDTPEYIGPVDNQNLHGMAQTDFVIVSDPAFLAAANRLADFHRQNDNMRVDVITTQQIYNEFSSGGQDLSAIRDFMKMLYDRAGNDSTQEPKQLLLFGDASVDYKNRMPGNTNFVPTFESAESEVALDAYCNDDFFGFLDDNENIEDYTIYNTLDVGIGRLPVKTPGEADDVVNKILHYKAPASLGPWRLGTTFVADNEDGAGDHLSDADTAARLLQHESDLYNSTKVYLDDLPFVSTPGGARCPDANAIINDQVYKGNFMINYSGHGNIYTLADERILTADDFNNWKNFDALPIVVTATCDFSQFDRPDFVSAGEKLILKNDGGAIAMLTTTQAVYAFGSKVLNQAFEKAQFTRNAAGEWRPFGTAFKDGKNGTYAINLDQQTLLNFRKFTLLGDPALVPDFPQYRVQTDSVLDASGAAVLTDTLKALGSYQLKASVRDNNGSLLSQFSGNAYVTIYDKPRVISLLTKNSGIQHTYTIQDNIIYKGKATVENGVFSISFIVPKDINYDLGVGKISYYVENGSTDGAGTDSSVKVGSFSDNPIVDNDAPIVRPYINDTLFRDGGLTGTNTLLYAILEDQTGINASGSSVGHDITGVLDGNVQSPYILNDYYETAPNNFRRGVIRFPLTGLADGPHSLVVKAWDANNNSGEGTVHFVVANGQVTEIRNLMNYPNPFHTLTHFVFEHNHPDEDLKVQMSIYSTSGRLVRRINGPFTPTGSRSAELTWDGTDDNGAPLPSGVYVYRLILSTAQGSEATAYQKLVLMR